ncbi:hypoxia-inducible factor 3-alpha-like [Uranotaenia lowii]|uniref:hypoxia-inducible factor 3-alpha-like n=1 Tax=Uranotaenia lowii TaxID=190385 RepID=UPI002478B94C|nr:hypoxia-inducible factor 3-alpha-like [Uranotaenia lowii]
MVQLQSFLIRSANNNLRSLWLCVLLLRLLLNHYFSLSLSRSLSDSLRRYDCEDSKSACKILNGREARNRAEKNRRDKLNGSIQELSSMVPHVAESPRRIDKTAVLRFSAHALRVDYVFGKSEESLQQKSPKASGGQQQQQQQQPLASPVATIVKSEVQDTLFRMLNGFLLTVTCRGQIVLVSASVEQFLGHCQTDLYGLNLFNLIHPDDHNLLKQQLIPSNLGNLFDGSVSAGSCSSSRSPVSPAASTSGASADGRSTTSATGTGTASNNSSATASDASDSHAQRSHEEEEEIDRKLRQDRRKFSLRIARAGPRSEPTAYELVTVDGCFRRADAAPRGSKQSGPSGLQLLRRARGRDDGISLHSINGNDIVLVAMVQVMKVPTICDRLIEACKYEYKTRHLIDGRIVQCDHRISVVAGYLTNEVSGLSPFTFMHKDDVRWVIVALRQMYDYHQKDGESCYRLMTRTGDFIYLKTTGYLEVDDTTKVVKSFVCINRLVPEDEGRRLVREMKQKYSVMVNQLELPDESDEPVVENPQQIERAVMNLITNLHPSEDDPVPVPAILEPSGSDQLAIIAPKPSQVKSAIVKSINVIAVASKKMSENGSESPYREESTSSGPPIPITQDHRQSSTSERPSVLQKVESKSSASSECHRVPPLPGSDHYFTQPISPYSTASSCSNSVMSPASQHVFQRNSRSPFGGSIPPMSPPATGGTMIYTKIHSVDSSGGQTTTRTTSVLKRTYSNSSIPNNNDDSHGGHISEYFELKRCRQSATNNLSTCLSELVNPATNLITSLPNAFEAVDQSLLKMENKTAMMRDQVSGYENLQHSQLRLNKIVVS